MRVLVLSDTHLTRPGKPWPQPLEDALLQADRILHAGDLCEAWVLDTLAAYAPVFAVHGNVDSPEVHALLPSKRVVELAGYRIGLVHGHLGSGSTTPERANFSFAPREADIVIFGHSHVPLMEKHDGRLLLNPGSPFQRRNQPQHSFAWLELHGDGQGYTCEHVFF